MSKASGDLSHIGASRGIYALQPRVTFSTDPNYGTKYANADPYDQFEVLCLAFSPDSMLLAAATSTGLIHIHSPDNGELICVLDAGEDALPITSIKFRPREYLGGANYVLAATCADGTVTHWHVPSQSVLSKISLEEDNALFTLDYSIDGLLFAAAGRDTTIRVYDEATHLLAQTLPSEKLTGEVSGHTNRVFSVKFHPASPHILVSGGWDNAVHIWDLRCGSPIRTIFGPHIYADTIDIACPTPHADTLKWARASLVNKADAYLEELGEGKALMSSAASMARSQKDSSVPDRVHALLELNRRDLGEQILASELLGYSKDEAESVLAVTASGHSLSLAGLMTSSSANAQTSEGSALLSRGVTRRSTSSIVRRTTTTRRSFVDSSEECHTRNASATNSGRTEDFIRKLLPNSGVFNDDSSIMSVESSYIFTGSSAPENPAQLWDLGTGRLIGEFNINARPKGFYDFELADSADAKTDSFSLTSYAACLSPSAGVAAVAGSGSPYAHLYSTQTFECLDMIHTDDNGCYAVRYSPNSHHFAVCGKQPVISVINSSGVTPLGKS